MYSSITCVTPLSKLRIQRQTKGAAKPKSRARETSEISDCKFEIWDLGFEISDLTCTSFLNVGNTLPSMLGRRHSISFSHVCFDTRIFIAMASSMLTNPSHLVFATPLHSSHNGQ